VALAHHKPTTAACTRSYVATGLRLWHLQVDGRVSPTAAPPPHPRAQPCPMVLMVNHSHLINCYTERPWWVWVCQLLPCMLKLCIHPHGVLLVCTFCRVWTALARLRGSIGGSMQQSYSLQHPTQAVLLAAACVYCYCYW
jgi:hypothetical protein